MRLATFCAKNPIEINLMRENPRSKEKCKLAKELVRFLTKNLLFLISFGCEGSDWLLYCLNFSRRSFFWET